MILTFEDYTFGRNSIIEPFYCSWALINEVLDEHM
jgi:hypothetical protein